MALYGAILITLQHILGFFTRPARSKSPETSHILTVSEKCELEKVLGALVHQDDYEEILTRSVQDVKDRSVKIKDLAIECSQERQKKMDEKITELLESHQQMREVFENLHRHLLSHPILGRSTREPVTDAKKDKQSSAKKSISK